MRIALTASFVLFLLSPGFAFAQAFGRFGYSWFPSWPGLNVDAEGIKAKHPAADRLDFSVKLPQPKLLHLDDQEQTLWLGELAFSPGKLRANLLSPGLEFFFPKGLRFRTRATQAPYLSWDEGSVGAELPTASAKWILITFRDAQPPLLLSFLDQPCSLSLKGKPGAWSIESSTFYQGWVRVSLPVGLQPRAASGAGELGRLVQKVKKGAGAWSVLPAKLVSRDVKVEPEALQVSWRFDRAGATVPFPVVMARYGGYVIEVLSPIKSLEAPLDEGPLHVCEDSKLVVRFPFRRIPPGRSLMTGLPAEMAYKVVPFDLPHVVELALACLAAWRDPLLLAAAEGMHQDYIVRVPYEQEPLSGQRMPYGADGKNLPIAAAHALLSQCLASAQAGGGGANPLLTSILWRRDWLGWQIVSPDRDIGRRTSALTAIALAMVDEPAVQAEAAMLQAGLACERALAVYRRNQGWSRELTKLIEPLEDFRRGLFRLEPQLKEPDPYFSALQSPIRVVGLHRFHAEKEDGKLLLKWQYRSSLPKQFDLLSPVPLELEAGKNLVVVEPLRSGDRYAFSFEAQAFRECSAWLKLPQLFRPLPACGALPSYWETPR